MNKFSFNDCKYLHHFKKHLSEFSISVSAPSNLAVLSDEFLTRKPYWVWLQRVATEQLQTDPQFILDFFGFDHVPAPDVFAWYCCIYHSYLFLSGSSSCHIDGGGLSYWGTQLQSILFNLFDYGVEERFITKSSAIALCQALLHPESAPSIPLIEKPVPSTYKSRHTASQRETAIGCGFLFFVLLLFLYIVYHPVYF